MIIAKFSRTPSDCFMNKRGENLEQKEYANLAHRLGKLPDRYWYQLNGKSAKENFQNFRQNRMLPEEEDAEPEMPVNIHITSEVKVI